MDFDPQAVEATILVDAEIAEHTNNYRQALRGLLAAVAITAGFAAAYASSYFPGDNSTNQEQATAAGGRLPDADPIAYASPNSSAVVDKSAPVVELTDQGPSACDEKLDPQTMSEWMQKNPGKSLSRPESAANYLADKKNLRTQLGNFFKTGKYQGTKGNLLDWVNKNDTTAKKLPNPDNNEYIEFLTHSKVVQTNVEVTVDNHRCNPDGSIESVGSQTFKQGEFLWVTNLSKEDLERMLKDTGIKREDLIILESKDDKGVVSYNLVTNRATCDNPLSQVDVHAPDTTAATSSPDTMPPTTAGTVPFAPTTKPGTTTSPTTRPDTTTTTSSTTTRPTTTSTTTRPTSTTTTTTSTTTAPAKVDTKPTPGPGGNTTTTVPAPEGEPTPDDGSENPVGGTTTTAVPTTAGTTTTPNNGPTTTAPQSTQPPAPQG